LIREAFAVKEPMEEGIFVLSFEFKNRLLIAEKYKKNSQLVFASWPLRRRTDEEIIRLS
jgi:hypothetical protein